MNTHSLSPDRVLVKARKYRFQACKIEFFDDL